MRSLTVPAGTGPMRLDRFLTTHVPGCSRRSAQRVIAAGEVRLNGRRGPKAQTVTAGDTVEVPDELYATTQLQPNPNLVVTVLHEDATLIAIDKPAGMPSHALRADETSTAANFLLARYPELAAVGKSEREPGLVHRLDTDTSGVLLAARTPQALGALRRQFAAHQVTKEYRALVHGDVAVGGELCLPIAHERHNRRKMRVCAASASRSPESRPAITRYRPLERLGSCTLLAVEIPTGVMHQIRVHLASAGHPIVGDRLYGGAMCGGDPPRHLLHASRITVVHPQTGRPLTIECALPTDFNAFVAQQRQAQRASTRTQKARH
jgi:23S rRNA pseudouridine1911/1915/1917 synthase